MAQVIDPLLVALINQRQYSALAAPRRNAGNSAYEWGSAAWLDVANTFALGPNTFRTGADGNKGLIVKANSGTQSANLLELQNSSGGVLTSFNAAGNFGLGINSLTINNLLSVNSPTTADVLCEMLLATSATTQKGLVIQGKPSQTANLQEFQNSSATVLTSIGFDGRVNIPNTTTTVPPLIVGASTNGVSARFASTGSAGIFEIQPYAGNTYIGTTTSDHLYIMTGNTNRLILYANGTSRFNTQLTVNSGAASNNGLIVQGAASQSGDLQQWQNSSGTVLSKVDAKGLIFPVQAPTASAPAYVKGAMYFDTTLSKLRIGGATGWETVTST